MMELYSFYSGSFFVGALVAICLTLAGSQVAPRKMSLETLYLAQAIIFSSLLGKLFFHDSHFGSLLFSIVFISVLRFWALSIKGNFKRNLSDFFIALFLVFLSLSYGIISYFPNLEAHMGQSFFGDLVTVSTHEQYYLGILSLFYILYFFIQYKTIKRETFEHSLGITKKNISPFIIFTFVLLVSSLFSMGLIYSLCFLLIPVTILSSSANSLKSLLLQTSLIALVSPLAGLGLSIKYERLSTVPLIVIFVLLLSLLARLFERLKERKIG